MSFDFFRDGDNEIRYEVYKDGVPGKEKRISFISKEDANGILKTNLISPKKNLHWYTSFSRFEGIDPYDVPQQTKEYLFFTKPDLRIFDNATDYSNQTLIPELQKYPFFVDMAKRYKNVLLQLQGSAVDSTGSTNPFMCLLSNTVSSSLDMPGVSANTLDSSSNYYGTSIQYRSHSIKSDNGYDFSLSFKDSPYLEVYYLAKAYDEYIRLMRTGIVAPFRSHIINRVFSEQFSIYKIDVSLDDCERIIYFAKITGVNLLDVPRSDMGDIPQDGIKFSLSFHGQFVDDLDPKILVDFNRVSKAMTNSSYSPVYDSKYHGINNEWVRYPFISVTNNNKKREKVGLGSKDYLLKWTNVRQN